MKQKEKKTTRKRNLLKIVPIVFILLFALVLVGVFLNMSRTPKFMEPTEEQVHVAKAIVSEDLETFDDLIENYEVTVTNRIVGFIEGNRGKNGMHSMRPPGCIMETRDCHENNVQVALRNGSTIYFYIIDVGSGKILMKSSTKWFDE